MRVARVGQVGAAGEERRPAALAERLDVEEDAPAAAVAGLHRLVDRLDRRVGAVDVAVNLRHVVLAGRHLDAEPQQTWRVSGAKSQ